MYVGDASFVTVRHITIAVSQAIDFSSFMIVKCTLHAHAKFETLVHCTCVASLGESD